MTTTTTTTTENSTTPKSEENRKKSFKYGNETIMAVRNVENKKGTKRMRKELENFDEKGCEEVEWFNSEKTQKVALDISYLGRLYELAKGSKSDTVELTVETDKPIHAQLLKTENYQKNGEILIAPKISTDIEDQREEITEKSEINQAKDLIRRGIQKIDQMDSEDKTREQLVKNIVKANTDLEIVEKGGEN